MKTEYEIIKEVIENNALNEKHLWSIIESRNKIIYDFLAIVEDMSSHSLDPEQFEQFGNLIKEIEQRIDSATLKERFYFTGKNCSEEG